MERPADKSLGWLTLAALGVNTIVGSGIFRLPAELARDLGPASILAFFACALLLGTVALSYAEAASMFERDGAAYAYARAALGPRVGFAVGWSAWVATVLTLASVAVAVPGQLAELLPRLESGLAGRLVAAAVIVALGAVNFAGRSLGAWTSNAFAATKLAALVLFVVLALPAVEWSALSPLAPRGWSAFAPAMLPAFFALSGFETSAIPAGDAARATRSVPLAVVASLGGAALLYALVQIAVVGVLHDPGSTQRPLVDAARIAAGPWGAVAISVLGAVSMIGLCSAMAFAGPRLLVALGEDGEIPRAFAALHPSGSTPRLGVAVTTLCAAGLVATLDFRSLIDFTSVVLAVQYIAACVSVIVLRRTQPDAARPVRLPFGPLLPGLGVALILGVLAQAKVAELALAAAALALGEVLSTIHRRSKRGGRPA